MPGSPVIISRSPEPVTLNGLYAPSLDDLLRWLEGNASFSDWLFADLSLGSWRGSLLANEFCAQLDLPPPKFEQESTLLSSAVGRPLSYADRIGVLIDAEASGNRVVLTALEAVTTIVSKVKDGTARMFVVIAPRFGSTWEQEDLLFLRFLAQGLDGTSSRIILALSDEGAMNGNREWNIRSINEPEPAHRGSTGLLGLVPGLVSKEVFDSIQRTKPDQETTYFKMRNGHLLIAPESRRPREETPDDEFELLINAAGGISWLKAYSQYCRRSSDLDSDLLSAQAHQRFAEGGLGIALKLLGDAIARAESTTKRSLLTVQAQGMRIALQRFEEAAEAPDPEGETQPQLLGFLCQTKGWGLVMTGQPLRAEPYFEQARELLKSEVDSREYLYLLNISALNSLKLGRADASLDFEKQIENTLEKSETHDWHLRFVNSINLARLYRRQRIFDKAAQYYDRAFATTLGARSESDSIYGNVCWANLHTECGSQKKAFLHWYLAALHWVSSTAPEALAPRAVAAILGRKLSHEEHFTEPVSAKLAANLTAAATALNVESVSSAVSDLQLRRFTAPTFIKSNKLNGLEAEPQTWCAVGADGWGVVLKREALPTQNAGDKHQYLRLLLCSLIAELGRFPEITDFGTIIVDDLLGREIPKTAYELLNTCVRLNVPRMIFDEDQVDLNSEIRSSIEDESTVTISDAVESIHTNGSNSVVFFKRYFSPKALSVEQTAVVTSIGQSNTVNALAKICRTGSSARLLNVLRILEESRVINIWA